jgi:hypothetical protein
MTPASPVAPPPASPLLRAVAALACTALLAAALRYLYLEVALTEVYARLL